MSSSVPTNSSTSSTTLKKSSNVLLCDGDVCSDDVLTDILQLAMDSFTTWELDAKLSELARWRLVSKQFNRVVCQPHFWRTLHWSEWRNGSVERWLTAIATNAHIVGSVTTFNFVGEYSVPGYMPPVHDDDLRLLFERFPSVRHLTLLQCGYLTDRGADLLIANASRLESLTFIDNWELSEKKNDELRLAFDEGNNKKFRISIQGRYEYVAPERSDTNVVWKGADDVLVSQNGPTTDWN